MKKIKPDICYQVFDMNKIIVTSKGVETLDFFQCVATGRVNFGNAW